MTYLPPRRTWLQKFRDAFVGVKVGVVGQSSFAVHLAAATSVVICAAWLKVSLLEWCLLLLCIATVLTAEMFNSALERLAKAVDANFNEHIAAALNIASAAVLVAALGAAAAGSLILGFRLLPLILS